MCGIFSFKLFDNQVSRPFYLIFAFKVFSNSIFYHGPYLFRQLEPVIELTTLPPASGQQTTLNTGHQTPLPPSLDQMTISTDQKASRPVGGSGHVSHSASKSGHLHKHSGSPGTLHARPSSSKHRYSGHHDPATAISHQSDRRGGSAQQLDKRELSHS